MSKKTPVKKSKRRLKRSVRRSLAAVLMITAVAVAAIPVPENEAAPDNPDAGDGAVTVTREYAYPVEEGLYIDQKGNVVDSLPSDPTAAADYKEYTQISQAYEKNFDSSNYTTPSKSDQIYKTHYIFSTSPNAENGGTSYRLEWQYEYYTRTINKEQKGIICGYNDTYPTEKLVVSAEPIHDYHVVKMAEYEAFKKKHENDVFYLNKEPSEEDAGDQEFRTYFPDLYNQQVAAYDKYKKENEAYQKKYIEYTDKNPGVTDEQIEAAIGKAPVEPKGIERTAGGSTAPDGSVIAGFSSENDEESWRLYYCNKTNGLKGYILERVADSEATTDAGGSITVFSFVPRRLDMSKKDKNDDDLGFKILDWTSFLGISDRAFYNVKNVVNIELPSALKYIGEHAFEDSFIESITMQNLANIGNFAFKNCPRLAEVNLTQGVQNIGTEAFYGVANLREITFPSELQYVGPGAFADCTLLNKVDFSKTALEVSIDDYAFYNDGALNEVVFKMAGSPNTDTRITTIGKAAFAVWNNASGSLTDFVFPSWIAGNRKATGAGGIGDGKGMGDYVLAGRTNLQHVTMPSAYGMAEETTVPDHLFQDCVALEWVNFPDTGSSCGFAKYEPELFASVANPDFFVQGPPYTQLSNRTPAFPRTSTWNAYTAMAATKVENGKQVKVPNVPYVYYLNGKRYTEVCDGEYLECIDENGVLISCSLKPGIKKAPGTVDLVIPATVAGTTVTGIASDCFANDANETDDRKMSVVVRTLTLQDDSQIETIDNGVFARWGNLERVYIGNSIRNIGDNAFQNCITLYDVYFNTPESAAADFKVGANAFQTNSSELTFHGMINAAYQPFSWAMDPNNTIDDMGRGIRVCYKSLAPTYLTVMRDNGTSQVTLLDYPKYNQIADILGESYAVRNGVYMEAGFDKAGYYQDFMEATYEGLYASTQYSGKREEFRLAYEAASTQEEIDALYQNFELYGPWVSRSFCNSFATTRNTVDAGNSAVDWLFEPLTAYAAKGRPTAYFDTYPYDVYGNYTNTSEIFGPYQTYTEEEWALLNATKNLNVPDGVTSIDVNGYMTSGNNNGNVANYLSNSKIGKNTYNMYYNTDYNVSETDRINDVYGGLFSGTYDDELSGEGDTIIVKGNDRLESINLNQVTYLPDYAFDSCENLRSVTIGAGCTDIRRLPFRGCTSLTALNIAEDNPKYLTENRILYSKNGEETYKLEECLETRGKNNDNSLVSSAVDPLLTKVTEIASAAFEACNYVSTVNLTDVTGINVIPENCFKDCESLIEVDLPNTVNKVDKGAFVGDKLTRLRIPGREVFISTDAFKHDPDKQQPTYIITYEDSSARRYADTYGDKSQYYLVWENIGESWDVKFYDMDGTLISATQVKDGEFLKRDQIPETPTHEGYRFEGWVGTNGVDVYNDAITQNTDVIAKFASINGTVDGNFIVNFYDGIDGEQLGPTQYIPAGESAVEPAYRNHEGYTFLKFSEDSTNVQSNMSIIALYTVNNGGSGNTTSGSTTNTSNGSGSNSNTSNKSSNTTNTSGSSTSSTSSSGTAPRHTVTVVNGYGSGSYAEGETVIIVADVPDGQKFARWRTESNGVNLVMVLASATTFVMPENNVLVTAEFENASTLTPPATGTVSTASTGNNTTPVGNTNGNNGSTRVDITKPGINNKDLATANVNGSTDNFIVKISETPEATQAVMSALTNKYGNLDNILYYAMDISLYDSTGITKITDTTGLTVDITIPIPDALIAYGGNNMMGAVVSGQLEDLSERFTTINGIPCISFTATHFSPYTIYVNTQNLSDGIIDTTPKTGDPIHPKWFLSLGLACLSVILFMKKDRRAGTRTA